MVAYADDLLAITIEVAYPKWMDEISVEEFNNVLISARKKVTSVFEKELDKFWREYREYRKQELEGQTSIYDYV